jgi:uncharacterized membrane protein required for colicin V production
MNPQDLLIIIVALLGVGYGFLLGRSRVVAALLGLYAGYAVAVIAGPGVVNWLDAHGALSQSSLPFIQLVILWVVTVLFVYRFRIEATVGKSNRGIVSHILTAIFSVLVVGLALSLTIPLLISSGQSWNNSTLAIRVLDYKVAWATLPLLFWVALPFLRQ